jgi:hypothetical protein
MSILSALYQIEHSMARDVFGFLDLLRLIYYIIHSMRKELVWAGVVGITFGLVIGFGTWRVRSSLKPKSITQATPTPQSIGQFKITLDKPSDNDVVIASPVTVTGLTRPLTWLTFSGETGDYIIQSNEQGLFAQDVELDPGVNQIKITSFDDQGNQASQKVLVVYSSSFQPNEEISNEEDSASDEAETSKAVAEKLAKALDKPKAYIGTVTDIADSTIQIKTTDSQIEQIAIGGDNISVVNTKGTTNKTIKLNDIAIGDFIVAMGYVNGKQVLAAQRILVTNPVISPTIDLTIARFTSLSKNTLNATTVKGAQTVNLVPSKNTELSSYLDGKLKTIKSSDINDNDLLVAVIDNTGDPPITRTIFNLGQPQSQ